MSLWALPVRQGLRGRMGRRDSPAHPDKQGRRVPRVHKVRRASRALKDQRAHKAPPGTTGILSTYTQSAVALGNAPASTTVLTLTLPAGQFWVFATVGLIAANGNTALSAQCTLTNASGPVGAVNLNANASVAPLVVQGLASLSATGSVALQCTGNETSVSQAQLTAIQGVTLLE